jgi:hypothetical protein
MGQHALSSTFSGVRQQFVEIFAAQEQTREPTIRSGTCTTD